MHITYPNAQIMQELDETDRKLLNLIQQNNKRSAEELGEELNLSPSAVQRRLQRLRSNGTIEADISVISPHALGLQLGFIVEVSLNLGNSSVIEEFKKLMVSCREVLQCYYVAGVYDFILIIYTKDMNHYERFSKTYLMDNKHVKQYYTHVMLNKVKVQYGVQV